MVVFVFSNSYLTRAAIHFLNFLSQECYICTTMDKHTINEFPDNLKNKLILKSNFEECIDLCDFCFIIKDITDSSLKIDYLISLIKTHGLPYYCIELSNNTETDLSKLMYLKTVPNILILNYGEYTQQYCTEIALFNAFKNREIDIFQKFSPFTDYFLKKTQEIIPIYTNSSTRKVLSAVAFQNTIFKNYETDNMIRELIHLIKPKYTILTANSGTDISDEMIKHIYYLYNVNIDCVVISAFTPLLILNKTIPMFSNYSPSSNMLFAEDPYLSDKLFERIEQKLVIPKGISVI